VPSFIWPGAKPVQIDYEIRDRIFPRFGKTSSIESPGFSSLLEAHINFGRFGAFGVYLLLGVAIAAFELLRTGTQSLLGVVMYLSLLPIAQTFHRSAFGPAVISVATMTVAGLILYAIVHELVAWLYRRSSKAAH
jgi:hypothetical protein